MVVMAIVGVVAAASAPWLITYWRSATLRAAAEELATGLNRGRQLAIAKGQRACIELVNNQYRYWISPAAGGNACAASETTWRWTGPGTDANGFYRLANNVTLTTNGNPVFDYLGAATGATFTVTNPPDTTALKVVVSVSGRVQITH
jgi:Tfp pilus assembly protein FimT